MTSAPYSPLDERTQVTSSAGAQFALLARCERRCTGISLGAVACYSTVEPESTDLGQNTDTARLKRLTRLAIVFLLQSEVHPVLAQHQPDAPRTVGSTIGTTVDEEVDQTLNTTIDHDNPPAAPGVTVDQTLQPFVEPAPFAVPSQPLPDTAAWQ